MKQVKFGSFPLAEILPKERECLDKYLIKHFADSISFKDTLTNLSVTKNTFYVGPSEIIRGMMNREQGQRYDNQTGQNALEARKYLDVQKRAFSVMGKFYTELTNSAFYKGLMYYPIYIEKVEKTMRGNRPDKLVDIKENQKGNDIDQRFSYSFVLLTNDLLQGTNRPVNEAGVINFLYIYLHLFHSPLLMSEDSSYSIKSTTGLASIDKDSIVLVMRFYKLIQKFDLNPVQVFLSIYNLINEARTFIGEETQDGIINSSQKNFQKALGSRLMSKTSKFDNPQFKNILKDVVKTISKLYTEGINKNPSTTKNSIRDNAKVMLSIVETMLREREIFDFVDDLSKDRHSRDSRMQAVADFHHYQDIIGLFEALVQFNELDISSIIKDTNINFGSNIILDSSIEDESERISRLIGVIEKGDFDTAFNKFYIDLNSFIHQSITNVLSVQFDKAAANKNARITKRTQHLEQEVENLRLRMESNDNEIDAHIMRINMLQSNPVVLSTEEATDLEDRIAAVQTLRVSNAGLIQQITDRESNITLYVTSNPLAEDNDAQRDAVTHNVSSNIFNNIDDALGFIYKDLENIFMNPIVLDKILHEGGDYTFDSIPQDASTLNGLLESHKHPGFGNSEDIVKTAYVQLAEDVEFLTESIVNEINNTAPNEGNIRENLIRENIIKSLGLRFFGIMKKHLRNIHGKLNKSMEYNNKLQGIHPLLGKMARDPKNFKTFILSTNVLSTLYHLIFITQEKMFMAGLIKRPPRKLNGADLQSRFIINNVLGLQNNPTWIIGENKIRLNLPDFLSLTGSPVQSEIPKNKLQSICKIDYKEYSWKSDYMGDLVPKLGDAPELKKIKDDIDSVDKKIEFLNKKKVEDLSPAEKTNLNELKNKKTELNDKLIKDTVKYGGVSLGNMGKILDKDNYSDFKSYSSGNSGSSNNSGGSVTSEEYDNLTPEEIAEKGIKDPKADELDHGFEPSQNENLDYVKQSGTANVGNYGDDIRMQMWDDKIRGRRAN